MKLVIDIHEKDYQLILNSGFVPYGVIYAIMHGTPLPKGHGRLIDADALEKKMYNREEELKEIKAIWGSSAVSVALNMFASTIIEADKEG